MVSVTEQYEAFPYPERDPADEAKRLIQGSPSHPLEIDHILFGGRRDWARPLRALVAGGGTGDGLIQLAAVLDQAKKPFEITYMDLSASARNIAEARARMRGLSDRITFVTGSLLEAPEHGPFDYIDCCGVLHHLPDPAAGFAALRDALAEGGGLGFMVYAPLGRSGVYPLQAAFGALLEGLPPKDRLARAKEIFARLPEGHPFSTNPHLVDHGQSDAGFYDLLLHGQDRSYAVPELVEVLDDTGWEIQSFATPVLYDPTLFATVPKEMAEPTRWALAENLGGTLKTHVAYAVPKGTRRPVATGTDRTLVPHLRGVGARPLAQAIAKGKPIPLTASGVKRRLSLPKQAAPLIATIDGRRSLSAIQAATRMDPLAFGATWMRVEKALVPWGTLLYSALNA